MAEPVAVTPSLWCARLCSATELPAPDRAIVREVEARHIAVFNVGGVYYCVDDQCTHSRSSLSQEGRCEGLIVECALHRARFSLETGRPLAGPTRRPLRVYDLECAGADVFVRERPKP